MFANIRYVGVKILDMKKVLVLGLLLLVAVSAIAAISAAEEITLKAFISKFQMDMPQQKGKWMHQELAM